MNCKRCGCYIGEYSGHGRPRVYCEGCLPRNNRVRQRGALGTTDISPRMSKHRDKKPDFKREANIVKKELRKLGLLK